MDIATAGETLAALMDVDEDRYPVAVRVAHMNQAMSQVSRQFETHLNEGVGQFLLSAGSGVVHQSLLSDESGAGIDPEVVTWLWYSQDFNAVGASPHNYTTNEKWKSLVLYPEYNYLMNTVGVDASAVGDFYGAAQYGQRIFFLNTQAVDTLFRGTFNGPASYLAAGENAWLRYAPWPIIYQTAQIACVWLEDEARIPIYRSLFNEAAEIVNIADSMRNDAPMESQEA